MSERSELLSSIAETISDYRADDGFPKPTPKHVDQWVRQFNCDVQVPILDEMNHVIKKTYVSKADATEFLTGMLTNEKLAGKDPATFWKSVRFLNIQYRGNSQREMLKLLDEIMFTEFSLRIDDCGKKPQHYLYLDDANFQGFHIINDFSKWISSNKAGDISLHIVTFAVHKAGQKYAMKKIKEAIKKARTKVKLRWLYASAFEDRPNNLSNSDVLRPTLIPNDEATSEYVESMQHNPVLRQPGGTSPAGIFSFEIGRNLLEQEFLKKGAAIRQDCPYLIDYMRPLGNSVLENLGFGTLFVTFRNCPNNCPLVFWAGNPWYPLFPRRIN
ncbi:hypothetical protein J7K50_02935 [bacterium]|nr:hypothetical protein [bacterium]